MDRLCNLDVHNICIFVEISYYSLADNTSVTIDTDDSYFENFTRATAVQLESLKC